MTDRQEVIQTVQSLPFVPEFIREKVLHQIEVLSDEELVMYARDQLPLVVDVIDSLLEDDDPPGPAFRRMCVESGKATGRSAFIESLGIDIDQYFLDTSEGLLSLAYSVQSETLVCILCMRIAALIPGSSFIWSAQCRALLAPRLSHIGRSQFTLKLLEEWLEIPEASYADDQTMRAALSQSKLRRLDHPLTEANLVTSLADSLMFLEDRDARHVVRLLEAWLGISEAAYTDEQVLLAALDQSLLRRLDSLVAEANIVTRLAECLSIVEGRGQRHAVMLLEAWLGISEAAYIDEQTLRAALDLSVLRRLDNPDTEVRFVAILAEAFSQIEKRGERHAALLLEVWLEIPEAAYTNERSLRDALDKSVLQRFDSHLTKTNLVTRLANSLRLLEGRGVRHAALLLEAWLEIPEVAYNEEQTLRAALAQSTLRRLDNLNSEAHIVAILADCLRLLEGRGARQAACLLEAWLEIPEAAYNDEQTLRMALDQSVLRRLDNPDTEAHFVVILAGALSQIEKRGERHAALLLEVWLEIPEAAYTNERSLRDALDKSVLQRFDSHLTKTNLVTRLANSLRLLEGRGVRHAALLLEAWLEIPEVAYNEEQTLRAALAQSTLRRLDNLNSEAHIVAILADCLRLLEGRGARQAACLLEAWLEIPEAAYNDEQTLRMALDQSVLRRLDNPLTEANLVTSLADSLGYPEVRRTQHAVLLLEVWLQIPAAAYNDELTLRVALAQSRLRRLNNIVTEANLVTHLADSLKLLEGRGSRHAVLLLETWLGISEAAYTDEQMLRAAIDQSALRRLDYSVTGTNLVAIMADCLRLLEGRGARQAALLLEAWLGVPMPEFSKSRLKSLISTIVLGFVRTWLKVADPMSRKAWDTCKAVVEYIQDIRETFLPTWQQRRDFLEQARRLRSDLERVALAHIDKENNCGNMERVEQIEQRILAWWEVFENRLLLEQMMENFGRTGGDGAAIEPEWDHTPWPFEDAYWKENRFRDDDDRPSDPFASLQAMSLPLEGRIVQIPQQTPVAHDTTLTVAQTIQRDQMLQLASKPVNLSTLLPDRAVWLRTTFDESDGRLRWWAVQRNGSARIIARGSSEPGASYRLECANSLFDLDVERIWFFHRLQTTDSIITPEAYNALKRLGEMVKFGVDYSQSFRTNEEERQFSEDLSHGSKQLRGIYGSAEVNTQTILDQHLRLAQSLYELVHRPSVENEEFQLSLDVLIARWNQFLELALDPYCESEREQRRRRKLEQASEQHRQAFLQELDLQPLLEATRETIDWSETDLIYTTQGPLWNAPWSRLQFGDDGRTLGQTCASVSAVVSLSLHRVGCEQLERQSPLTRRLLSAHWLERQEREHMLGLPRLHAALSKIASKRKWEMWGLGDTPQADCPHVDRGLSRGIDTSSLAVLGGHGSESHAGVLLADGLWDGTRADMSLLDLLILVACVVGRLNQQGNRDVEGLYAKALAAQCRSLIAARWPIADTEAAEFVAVLVEEYFRLVEENDGCSRPFLRARALNAARNRLHNNPDVTRHLTDAFELYGVG